MKKLIKQIKYRKDRTLMFVELNRAIKTKKDLVEFERACNK